MQLSLVPVSGAQHARRTSGLSRPLSRPGAKIASPDSQAVSIVELLSSGGATGLCGAEMGV